MDLIRWFDNLFWRFERWKAKIHLDDWSFDCYDSHPWRLDIDKKWTKGNFETIYYTVTFYSRRQSRFVYEHSFHSLDEALDCFIFYAQQLGAKTIQELKEYD